jgi:hypothetical protein
MPRRLGAYLHPFDLDWLAGKGGPAALAGMGCTDLIFPSAYHAGRWTTPVGQGGLVRFLEDGIVHYRPGEGRGPLQPRSGRDVPATGPTPLEECIAAAGAAGLTSHAWTVLFHNSRLGRAHPDSCIRNAVGDTYEYALCPARPEVQSYALQVVGEVAAHPGLCWVELEAVGFMGYRHTSHHDKTSIRPDRALDFLLSLCFCDTCSGALGEQGVDGTEVAVRVAGLLRERLDGGDCMAPPASEDAPARLVEDLGEPVLRAVLRHRERTCTALLARLLHLSVRFLSPLSRRLS